MPKRTKILIAIGVMALIAASWLIPVYGEICEKDAHTGQKDCAAYHISAFILWHVGEFLNYYGVAITAIATAFIGFFTYTLYSATNKQAKLTRDAIKLGTKEFIATHRPRLIVRFVEGDELRRGTKPNAEIRMANVGETDATIVGIGVDIFTRYPDGRPIHGWYAVPQNIPVPSKIQPSQELKFTVTGARELDETDQVTLTSGDSQLCMIGIVRYMDDNQTERTTSFARLYNLDRKRYMRVAKDDPHSDYEYAN